MAIDIESLTAPLSDEAPSGPDLSYEAERQQIEAAFDRAVDDQGGESDVDWREMIALILGEAAKTRDMCLAVYLMRAAARAGNFDQVVDGAELLARLVEERWDDVHPQLDEVGFIGRKSPCESLTRIAEFLGPLARVPLLEHPRLGRYSGSDFERFKTEGGDAEGFGMFRAALEASDIDDLKHIVDRLDAMKAAIARADAVMTERAEGDTATNFEPTYEALGRLRTAVAANLPAGAVEVADAPPGSNDDGWESPAEAAAAPSGPGFSGGISSRADVVRALDAICAYYARCEPASPVPMALRRARAWISLDFMAVLEDIAPGGLDEAKRVLKSGRETSDGDGWGDSSSSESSSSDGW